MAIVKLTNDIPDSTALLDLVFDAELESYAFFDSTGFFNFDTDQAVEDDESDLSVVLEGKDFNLAPIPNGTLTGLEVKSLDTGLTWATVSGLPDLDAGQLLTIMLTPGSDGDLAQFLFAGDDVMTGADANDILNGFGGYDLLTGNGGRDVLSGGTGADTIRGGSGRDVLTGGRGGDLFIFDENPGRANADRITDFGRGADYFSLDKSRFDTISAVTDPGVFVVGSAAADGDSRIIYNDVTGKLFFDEDGTGSAAQKLFAIVDKGTVLEAGDFLLT